jgi:hypothetical protein
MRTGYRYFPLKMLQRTFYIGSSAKPRTLHEAQGFSAAVTTEGIISSIAPFLV